MELPLVLKYLDCEPIATIQLPHHGALYYAALLARPFSVESVFPDVHSVKNEHTVLYQPLGYTWRPL